MVRRPQARPRHHLRPCKQPPSITSPASRFDQAYRARGNRPARNVQP
jgi:hypothetical protein